MTSIRSLNWIAPPFPACQLAESPRFCHNHWVWLDIDGQVLYRCDQADLLNAPATAVESQTLPDQMGCVLPTQHANQYMLYGRQGIYHLNWPAGRGGAFSKSAEAPFNPDRYRFNDGRADINGRAWVSTLSDARTPGACLFRLDQHTTTSYIENLIVGNGLAFSPNGDTMYFADTRQRKVWRFDCDPQLGVLKHQELLAEYTQGAERPDGATVASDGSYLVAVLEGYRLDRYHLNGKLLEEIELPLAKPTMPCLGGPGLNQLMVTGIEHAPDHPNRTGFETASLVVAQTELTGIAENAVNPTN